MLFVIILEYVQNLTSVLENFCMHNKLSINFSKTMVTLVKVENKDKVCIVYNIEPFQIIKGYKYIRVKIPSNHNNLKAYK